MNRSLGYIFLAVLCSQSLTIFCANETWFEAGFQSFSNGFRTVLDNTRGGLDVISKKVVNSPIGKYFCDTYHCLNGDIPIKNQSMEVFSNGCGSYGYSAPQMLTPGLGSCCDFHDFCYARCGSSRSECDHDFGVCLRGVCAVVKQNLGEGELFRSCTSLIKIMVSSVETLGCGSFLTTQKMYCYCGQPEREHQPEPDI